MSYAGFWKRVVAALIDFIIVTIGSTVAIYLVLIMMLRTGTNDPAILENWERILGFIIAWLYYAGMESSSTQATLGKKALGIKVTDLEGNSIGFGKATRRYFGKIISAVIMMIGFLMVAFTQKKQGLHDMMAGCLVVNR